MDKPVWVAALLLVVGCGDNGVLDSPPALIAPKIRMATSEDTATTIDATARDLEGDTLTYTTTAPGHGALSGTGPTFTYTPDANWSGDDSFSISISDGTSTLFVPVTVTVVAVNDAPVARNMTRETPEDHAVTFALDVSDVDSPSLNYTVVTQPVHGTLSGTIPDLTYTPFLHYFGTDSFTFSGSDGVLSSNIATATVTVDNVIACGDGVTEGTEQCDDGNTDNHDSCLNACTTARCGDGVVQDGVEDCDDGNDDDNDECRNDCTFNVCFSFGPVPSCCFAGFGATPDC